MLGLNTISSNPTLAILTLSPLKYRGMMREDLKGLSDDLHRYVVVNGLGKTGSISSEVITEWFSITILQNDARRNQLWRISSQIVYKIIKTRGHYFLNI